MRPTKDTLKLPAALVNELGGQDVLSGGRKGRGLSVGGRKEKRKAEREQKKGPPPSKRPKLQHKPRTQNNSEYAATKPLQPLPRIKPSKEENAVGAERPKSILKKSKQLDKRIPASAGIRSPSPPPRRISRGIQDKLAEDDEEIAALEMKLGLKGKKGLPQSFKDDGLDELLEGLGDYSDDEIQDKRKLKAEGDKWLAQKRKNARLQADDDEEEDEEDSEDEGFENDGSEDESVESQMSLDGNPYPDDDEGEESDDDDAELSVDEEEDDDGFGGFESDTSAESQPKEKRVRENPYVAPAVSGGTAPAKYIPPSLRKPSSSDSESLVRLRRQTQGLVNRLTETNLISILGDIEKLYRENARQHVTSTLVDLLLTSVCEPTSLPDTLIILPAGFIAAIYKIIGTDFGAQAIQRSVELFDEHYIHATKSGNSGPAAATTDSSKETSNLITLLSELYNFQVVGSNLMFDYIRLFLGTLSELNAELLLKIIRTSGPQLRQDDPSALKDIVNMLRPAVNAVGEANISVRTKFMIETINDLKNNKMKSGAAASAVTSEHTIRMKKTLGTLNTRNIKGSEPLRIGLKDIQESDKKGKWWLVGASWAGNETDTAETQEGNTPLPKGSKKLEVADAGTSDLTQLAREQRMNTDIRRAIFITIMSASDFQDANMRLMKLKLKKVQELEIPKVLIHCSAAEAAYNPYYTLIAKKLCGDRKLKMAFQFSLWDLFKRMGENDDEDDVLEEDDGEDALDTRQIVNLAKMFGTLITEGGLTLSVLKNLNLSYLQSKTKTFVEVLFITIFLQSQKQSKDKRDEKAVVNIVSRVRDTPSLTRGLLYFLRKVVGKTDIAGGKTEKTTVKWACKVATTALDSILLEDNNNS